MKRRILWITRTAVLLALLLGAQFATRSLGQLVTGSCVNTILAVAALTCGLWSAAAIALLSPWLAFLLGIGPQLVPIVPMICVGNVLYVLLLWLLAGKGSLPLWRRIAALLAASCAKALSLYLLVVQLLCHVLTLSDKQIANFTAMFSWAQLVTALLGGALALAISPILSRALHRQRP